MRVAFPGLKDGSSTPSDKLELSFTGPLVLTGNPTEAKEAANKNVVDSSFASLDASKMIDGTLTVDRLPEYTGDVGNVAGNNLFTLNPTGVSSGNHSKVTVDSKGRVVSAAGLEVTDIPPFDWTKITRNTPVSLNGYGITDGVKKSGDVIDGELVSGSLVTEDLHAATKEYVEGVVSAGGSNVNVGAVVSSSVEGLVGGFLRANGAEVNKAAYAELYSVLMSNVTSTIRLDYTSYAAMGAGKPWCQQYDFKTSDVSELTNWTTGPSLPGLLGNSQAIVTNKKVYLINGLTTNSAVSNVIYSANINEDGTLGSWSNIGPLPQNVFATQLLVIKNKAYLIGGVSNLNGDKSHQIYVSNINADGSLGPWTSYNNFPEAVGNHVAFITKNRVYVFHINKIFSAPVDVNGNILTWNLDSYLPHFVTHGNVIITKNRIYLITGQSGKIITTTINSDGTLGSWTTFATDQGDLAYSQVLVFKNNVYIIGAEKAGQAIYKYNINTDGTLGALTTYTNALPISVGRTQTIVTKNRVYLLGGVLSGAYSNATYTTLLPGNEPISDYSKFYDGSINKFDGSDLAGDIVVQQGSSPYDTLLQPGSGKPWKQQYDINVEQSAGITGWSAGNNLLAVLAYSQAIVTKNRVYLLGGYISTGNVSAVYTAPINTDGTLGTWVTGTFLPGPLGHSQAIVTKNRVYLLGGYNGHASTVYTAPINEDGTLGAWTTGTSLPGGLGHSQAIVTKNRVYLLGGFNGSGGGVSTVYTAPINTDGTLGTWTTGSSLPEILYFSQAIVTKNRVYLLGGFNGSWLSTVYTAPINADGTLGAWTTGTSLPGGLGHSQAIVTKNRVYLLGGFNGSTVSTVYTAPINADGTLGAWTTGSGLPGALYASQAIVTKNRVYLLGGYNGSYVSTVYIAPILGGLNDYSPYYNGTITPTNPNNFKLPDYSLLETSSEKYYIKY